MTTLDVTSLNLSKGQTADLDQEAGKELKRFRVALGWDLNANTKIDLDVSAVVINKHKQPLGVVYFNQKNYNNGAVVHNGDNLTGAGDGDDETVDVNIDKLPPEAAMILFTITNYTGQKLKIVKNAFARIIDLETNKELVRTEFKPPVDGQPADTDMTALLQKTGLYMVLVTIDNGSAVIKSILDGADGKTVADLIPNMTPHLS